MNIDEAIKEWKSKKRRRGCVSASKWLCKQVPGFYTESLDRYTPDGEYFRHVVASDGFIRIDLTPHKDVPEEV